jgi:SNF2 family DNA or RNA helicase
MELPIHWLLLLSGTPVQNNMKELQGLMSLLDADKWGDQEEFLEQFGEEAPSLEQIKQLQVGMVGLAWNPGLSPKAISLYLSYAYALVLRTIWLQP